MWMSCTVTAVDRAKQLVQVHHTSYRTVLYCTVLYCTVLYCTVLYCTVLYCTVLYCTVLSLSLSLFLLCLRVRTCDYVSMNLDLVIF